MHKELLQYLISMKIVWMEFKSEKGRKKTEKVPGKKTLLYITQTKEIPGRQDASAQRLTAHRECCRSTGSI